MNAARGQALAAMVLLLALAGCATTGATRVSGQHADITFPATSPVAPVASAEPGGRRFAGRFTMSGRFRYTAATPGRDAVVEFVPDPGIARRLPYFAALGHVRRIEFDNASTFVEEAIPAATLARLAKGEITIYTGQARIVVDGLFASVDCDQPGYTVTFVGVEWIGDTASTRDPAPDHDGC